MNSVSSALTLLLAIGVLSAGTVTAGRKRWALAVAGATVGLTAVLPLPRIEEGHNVFLYTGPGGAFERSLPPEVFAALHDDLLRLYPEPPRAVPAEEPYAFSADAALQRPRLSRIVHDIDVPDRRALRLGAFNELRYNLYGSQARPGRDGLPFFVRYDLPPELAGGALCWQGDVFWSRAGGGFERLRHNGRDCRTIPDEATARQLYAVESDPARPLAIALAPPPAVAAWSALAALAGPLGAVLVLGLLVTVRLRDLVLPGLAIGVTLAAALVLDPGIGSGFVLYEGGNDGLTYATYGRAILNFASQGDWWNALRGQESVFFFMPGQRYAAALQLLLFGETAFGFLIVACLLPLVLLRLLRRWLPAPWAVGLFAVFLLVPVGENFGFWSFYYLRMALRGFGEPIAYTLFLLALTLVLPRLPEAEEAGERGLWGPLGAGLVLAAVAIRPNLAPGAGVLLATAALLWLRRGRAGEVLALAGGFAPVLLVPLHNWVFGGQFVPFTTAADMAVNLQVAPGDWLRALGDLLAADWHSDAVHRAAAKLRAWVAPYEVWRQAAVAAVLWALLRRATPPDLRTLAAVALVQHGVLLVYVSGGRYGHLTWTMTLLVLLAVIRRDLVPWMMPRLPRLAPAGRALAARLRPAAAHRPRRPVTVPARPS